MSDDAIDVFELGAGYGFNLRGLASAFPQARIFSDDLDVRRSDRAHAAATLNSQRYDVVLFSHVLEHLVYPKAWVRQACAALRPGGVFLVEVPNDTMTHMGLQQTIEPHLTFFTANSLARLMTPFLDDFGIEGIYSTGQSIAELKDADVPINPRRSCRESVWLAVASLRYVRPMFRLIRETIRGSIRGESGVDIDSEAEIMTLLEQLPTDPQNDLSGHLLRLVARRQLDR